MIFTAAKPDQQNMIRDFPNTTSYWLKTVALSVVEDDYGLDREIAWRSPGDVRPIGRLDGSCSDRYGALRAHFDTREEWLCCRAV